MKVTFLGTGTSTGVPVLTCKCSTCGSLDFRDKRLRSSVFIQVDNQNWVIDVGPDFRQQALRAGIPALDAVLFTHEHKDHTGGLDDIRPYNYLVGSKGIHIFAHIRVLNQLRSEYYYAFEKNPYPGVPKIISHNIENEPFYINKIRVIPINLHHHKLQVFGFRIKNFAYLTDTNRVDEIEIDKLQNLEVLVINALQPDEHISHFNLSQAIAFAHKVKAQKFILRTSAINWDEPGTSMSNCLRAFSWHMTV